jgi:hypothetical protein
MRRRTRTSRAAIATAAVLTALTLLPLAAGQAGARQPSAAKTQAEHARILKYWTPKRLANATPRDLVRATDGTARVKPGTAAKDVKGASWTGGGEVVEATGVVVFTMGGIDFRCSGSVVDDSRGGFSLVLTAAHCAYDDIEGAFATNWMFIPEWDTAPTFTCAASAHGCWTAQGLVVRAEWASGGPDGFAFDYAVAIVGAGDRGTQLDSTVGSFPIQYGGVAVGDRLYAFGYPSVKRYSGTDLTYCFGDISTDKKFADQTWGMKCDMTAGSSGGPWFDDFSTSTGDGTLSSLSSYSYGNQPIMYGPKFTAVTESVVEAADSGNANQIVE